MLPTEHEPSDAHRSDGKAKVCAVLCDVLIRENQRAVDKYLQFCDEQYVVPVLKLDEKQLHLFGSPTATNEAEKRFLELQNQLLLAKSQHGREDRAHWWYEAWDGTWQLYNDRMITHIEQQHRSKRSNFTMLNEIGEKVSIDLTRSLETYGPRTKRLRRSKLDDRQPSHWTITPSNSERVLLDNQSNEYLTAKNDFDKTMRDQYTTLISIERIQNLAVFKQFHALHEDYIERYGSADNGTMRFLFHGCPERVSLRIVERGFNRSFAGVNGCLYGRGVYFTSSAKFSDKYAKANNTGEKRMFYSRVLVGKSMIGRPDMCEPADGFDTTTDGSHIFVCYHDGQCYPEYLLTYV